MGIKVTTDSGDVLKFATATRLENVDSNVLIVKDSKGEILAGINNWDYYQKYDPATETESK